MMRFWLLIFVFAFSCVDPAYAVRLKKGCEGVSRPNVPNAPRLKKGCKAVYRPNLLYRLTFNQTAPFGTDESASSTDDCLTHGADATTGRHRCQLGVGGCTAGGEGDACMQVFGLRGNGLLRTDWFDKWTGAADTPVRRVSLGATTLLRCPHRWLMTVGLQSLP